MSYQFNLHKMQSIHNDPVDYYWRFAEDQIHVNRYLNTTITLKFIHEIYCIQCGRKTNRSFQQGYCFPCLRRLQECNLCIIHPERCQVEKTGCPQDDWAHAQCNQPHVIYLANTSTVKVGITRTSQVPTRWIDQGAIQALAIFTTINRFRAGLIEVALKSYVADRTDWRKMLKNQTDPVDLRQQRDQLLQQARSEIHDLLELQQIESIKDSQVLNFSYPIIQSPEKVSALSLDKTAEITAKLLGIKGQYLIFDQGVLNVRKYAGYRVELTGIDQ